MPRSCIGAGVHYCDIADSRSFVIGITTLDDEARKAGVAVISGASSVPALSGAVIRALSKGMERVSSVETAISASNRASAGPAVSAAILGQVGQRFHLWRGGRLVAAYGWQQPQRITFALPGLKSIRRRMVALVEVPDVALIPEQIRGGPAVTFRAGTELLFHNAALWWVSWLVRWKWLRSLAPLAPRLASLQALTSRLGSDRSAMMVRLFGEAAGRRVERRWTLIADAGDGPEIPALSIRPILERMLRGDEPAGARDASRALELDSYESAFATLAIRHGIEERCLPKALYHRVMGERFDALPRAVRQMHDVLRDGGASGEANVVDAATRFGAVIARLMRFPPSGTYPLHVDFTEMEGEERWARHFGAYQFSSILTERNGDLVERFGPVRFYFALLSEKDGLSMNIKRWSAFGIRLPLALAPRSPAREWEDSGRFHFDVPIDLPLIGRIVHYRGWLVLKSRRGPSAKALWSDHRGLSFGAEDN